MPPFESPGKTKRNRIGLVIYTLPPLLISLLFYVASPNHISWVQWGMALLLLLIPWMAYFKWKQRSNQKLPVFAIISFMYWVYYALSLFWGSRTVSGTDAFFER